MVHPNHQYFVVRIDKQLQKKKRENLVSKKKAYFGSQHDDDEEGQLGVKIAGIEPKSPAYEASFKPGDVIVGFDDVEVKKFPDMIDFLSKKDPGQEVTVHYRSSFFPDRVSKKKVKLGEKDFSLVLPPQNIEFQYNLQFGEIVAIGDVASEKFPEALVGDILIFHHAVEHKPRAEGDRLYNDFHLVDTYENGDEERMVNYVHEVFGVFKREGEIIPYKDFVFCHPNIKKSEFQLTETGIWIPEHYEISKDELQDQIEELNAVIAEINTTTILSEATTDKNFKEKDRIFKIIQEKQREKSVISKKMNQLKMADVTVMYINPATVEELGAPVKPGDTLLSIFDYLYPLDLFGERFALARKDWIEAVIHKN